MLALFLCVSAVRKLRHKVMRLQGMSDVGALEVHWKSTVSKNFTE
jgi:hypothetical protein